MPIRIVCNGEGYTTRIFDEAGQDITRLLQVSSITLACDQVPTAHLTALFPRVDIVVQEATLLQRCPYCGHERISKMHSAHDLDLLQTMPEDGGA